MISYITPACVVCGVASTMQVDEGALAAWQSGTLIQKAFPDMNVDHRELLISGIHPWCWEVLEDEVWQQMTTPNSTSNDPSQNTGSGSTTPTGGSSEPEENGMKTTIVVVDGADGLTPDMLRVRKNVEEQT